MQSFNLDSSRKMKQKGEKDKENCAKLFEWPLAMQSAFPQIKAKPRMLMQESLSVIEYI